MLFKLGKSWTLEEVALIDVCDNITLSFTLEIIDKHTIPNGFTPLIGFDPTGRMFYYILEEKILDKSFMMIYI